MNWRKRKKLWKRQQLWLKRNGSNKSLHTMLRICHMWKPDWSIGS